MTETSTGPSAGVSRRDELALGLSRVRQRIADACERAGRDVADITLVVVTKTHPVQDLRLLAEFGVRDLGESREQELTAKHRDLGPVPGAELMRWHFIGRLQTNKARRVARAADLVHSVDRGDLLAPLSRGAATAGREVGALVQVSLDGDPTRGGVVIDQVWRLADEVARTEHLRLRGLMAVAPRDIAPERAFAVLKPLSRRLCLEHPGADILSAGMSADLEAAVTAGATHLRVGTAILGARAPLR